MERKPPAPVIGRRSSWTRRWALCAMCCWLAGGTGCSLFVMAGKFLVGDPMVDADFEAYTKKSLDEKGKKVVVVCQTPDAVKSQFSSLDVDLLAQLTRRLAAAEVDVVRPHKVASWIDDNGGVTEIEELAKAMEADYVIQITVDNFDYREENSPNLFRGRSSGTVNVYEVTETDGRFEGKHIYSKGFTSVYPNHKPVSVDDVSEQVFRKKYLDRVSDELARLFYNHKAGADI